MTTWTIKLSNHTMTRLNRSAHTLHDFYGSSVDLARQILADLHYPHREAEAIKTDLAQMIIDRSRRQNGGHGRVAITSDEVEVWLAVRRERLNEKSRLMGEHQAA